MLHFMDKLKIISAEFLEDVAEYLDKGVIEPTKHHKIVDELKLMDAFGEKYTNISTTVIDEYRNKLSELAIYGKTI